jgi:hypothetical protein
MRDGMIISVLALVLAATIAAWAGDTNPAQPASADAVPSGKLTDDQLGDLLQQAILLARVGLYDEAAARCQQILQQKPDQTTVKQLLTEIDQKRRKVARAVAGVELKQKLENTILPEVKVREAAVADVIESLRAQCKKLTGGQEEINVVWQVPPGRQLAKVTLSLRNVPVLDAIRYVTELARLKFRVDDHAVVIFLAEDAVPAKGPFAPPDQHGQP